MFALSFPDNTISLVVFTDKETAINRAPNLTILSADPRHILKQCISTYSGGIIICSSINTIKIPNDEIEKLLIKWKTL